MQLAKGGSIRGRLGAAACLLLASGAPVVARAEGGSSTQIDASMLLYGEKDRTSVYEPAVRATRLFANGQSLSAQFEFDAMTGASPNGALPSGRVQTTTSASGTVKSVSAGEIPTAPFHDMRGALDLEWKTPLLSFVSTTFGTHFSREKDYQSLGGSGSASIELFHKRLTLTGGVSDDEDRVMPVGGTPVGLTTVIDPPPPPPGGGDDIRGASAPGTSATANAVAGIFGGRGDPKRVRSAMVGVSQVVTRRWLLGVDAALMDERGYLTEPYKVVSVIDPQTGFTVSKLTENRPGSRVRRDVLGSSVYHLSRDILYANYRYYWDDWGIRSHTVDLQYRKELGNATFLQPHLRAYWQTPADFFRFGIVQGTPLPEFASSDERLGPLRTATAGATYGFQLPGHPGEFTVRAEFIGQWGKGHPADAIGVQRQLDLFPMVKIGTVLVGYSFTL